ncbi:PREDICTED: uncharacterized protein LOC104759661 [Camelina sativa]|uniref:Uncharacterized protein LOC104759661 n=1 Tax=Camelina sativa TaxID=90675 RepID=A0ABM0X567_CAMSA|nr:PREDICTED: uncharacterized protein LOC104759661 [Camelina sativa]
MEGHCTYNYSGDETQAQTYDYSSQEDDDQETESRNEPAIISSIIVDVDSETIDDVVRVTSTPKKKSGRRKRVETKPTKKKTSTSAKKISSKKPPKTTKIDYLDHGDPTYTCKFCGALMWYDERINKRRNQKNPIFTLCCGQGSVKIPFLAESPDLIKKLLSCDDPLSKNYEKHQHIYNMVFAMTSLGGKVDRSIPKGSLKPENGDYVKYSQLYIADTENEVDNRATVISKGKGNPPDGGKNNLKKEIIESIIQMLNTVNPYVQNFRSAKDRFDFSTDEPFHMRIVSDRVGVDGRTYSMPKASEVAALIPGDFRKEMPSRDIVIEEKSSGRLQRISEIHISYLALQYPLIFCYGEDEWRPGIEKAFIGINNQNKNKSISMRQWFAFRIQEKENDCQTLIRSKRLFQQFLCDAYTTIETNRLSYIKYNVSKKRCENYTTIKNAMETGNTNMSEQGNQILIPSSFTGGSRYMVQSYYDAMAICKHYGFPDLFITFTCNPKWPEITRYVQKRGLTAEDRPDIVARIFKIKLESLLKDLTEKRLLGKTKAAMYTIEFQKRGLPHVHILLWMDAKTNTNSPCMKDGRCSKLFPKKYEDITKVGSDGYPIYRRRRSEHFVEKGGIKCDNRYVVPYNAKLSLRYRAHINVEWCNQSSSIKYLFKYINKDPDGVAVIVEPANKTTNEDTDIGGPTGQTEKNKNEIKDFFDCRYVSASEAIWRIFKFSIQYRSTPVQKLSFHVEGKQPAYYDEDEEIEDVLDRVTNQDSQFMAWMTLCRNNAIGKNGKPARELTYVEIPGYFTWDGTNRQFSKRSRGFSLGRIHYVPRKLEDEYFLREFFAMLILLDSLSRPEHVWEETWKLLSEDIENKKKEEYNNPDLTLTEAELKNYALQEIEKIMLSN